MNVLSINIKASIWKIVKKWASHHRCERRWVWPRSPGLWASPALKASLGALAVHCALDVVKMLFSLLRWSLWEQPLKLLTFEKSFVVVFWSSKLECCKGLQELSSGIRMVWWSLLSVCNLSLLTWGSPFRNSVMEAWPGGRTVLVEGLHAIVMLV